MSKYEREKEKRVFGLDHCWVKGDKLCVHEIYCFVANSHPPLPILPFLSPFQDEGWCSSKLLPVKRMSRPKPLWLYFPLYPSFQEKLLVVGHLLKPLVTHVLTWPNKSSPHPSFKLGEECEETGREEMTQKMEQRWGKGVDRKQANRITKLLFSVIENFTLRKLGNLGLFNRMIKERYYYLRTIT